VTSPLCPLNVLISLPVETSQSLRVLSALPETNVLPSGEKAMDVTRSLCPSCTKTSGLSDAKETYGSINSNRKPKILILKVIVLYLLIFLFLQFLKKSLISPNLPSKVIFFIKHLQNSTGLLHLLLIVVAYLR